MRTIAASCTIDAPLPRVWQTLIDVGSYPSWSPFVVAVDGPVEVGGTVTLHVAMTPGRKPLLQREVVSKRTSPGPDAAFAELSWGTTMGASFVLVAERAQRLTALGPGQTRYETADTFTGMLVPVVFALYGAAIQRGFDATAVALKRRVEGGAA